MDVKYVPVSGYAGADDEKFYQHTMMGEAGRERFIYADRESSIYSTVNFIQRAIAYFAYAPDVAGTDNGSEV